jgi:hypothetical protein
MDIVPTEAPNRDGIVRPADCARDDDDSHLHLVGNCVIPTAAVVALTMVIAKLCLLSRNCDVVEQRRSNRVIPIIERNRAIPQSCGLLKLARYYSSE